MCGRQSSSKKLAGLKNSILGSSAGSKKSTDLPEARFFCFDVLARCFLQKAFMFFCTTCAANAVASRADNNKAAAATLQLGEGLFSPCCSHGQGQEEA